MAQLPPASVVTVTCSPTKGIAATLDLAARLRDAGHVVVPHLAARLVEDRDAVNRLAAWLRDTRRARRVRGRRRLAGSRPGGTPTRHGLAARPARRGSRRSRTASGVTAYPDGHIDIPEPRLRAALQDKQALLTEAGVAGYATTQMCFEPLQIRAWLATERLAGLRLPVLLGVPGVVERAQAARHRDARRSRRIVALPPQEQRAARDAPVAESVAVRPVRASSPPSRRTRPSSASSGCTRSRSTASAATADWASALGRGDRLGSRGGVLASGRGG